MATVDSLDIQISAQAQNAEKALNSLVSKLNTLSASLRGINGSGLTGLANGVNKLATSMQGMNAVKTTDFTRLAKNIEKLANLNTQGLNSSASALYNLTRAFNTLGGVSQNAIQVGELAKNISKLGNKSVQNAISNIPQLAVAMKSLMTTLSKAPKVSQNIIQMTNALANLASQGSRIGFASNSIVNGLNRTTRASERATKSTWSLAAAFGKFYATYFLVIRGIKKLWSSIESTADYVEAYNYLDVALGKVGADWAHQYKKYGYENAETYAESFTTRLQKSLSGLSGLSINIDKNGNGLLSDTGLKNLGLNIQEVTQYASQLASVTNSVGQTGEVSLAAANAFTKLGADISSLFNIDYSSVMGNLQSGLIGQSRALYKYGIDITNATLQTYAYNLGLEKAVSEMTQAEKMQLRMIAILDQSKVSWGDLANTINSPSNMIRQFKNNLKEAGMVLGQLFVPLLQKVLPVINGITIALKRLFVSIANIFGIKLDLSSFGQGFSDTEEDISGVSDSLDSVADSAKKAKAGLRGFDELKVINMPDESSASSGAGAGASFDLTNEITQAVSEYEKVWNEAFANMQNKAEALANKFEKIFEPIKKLFQDIKIGDWFAVGEDVSNIVIGITDALRTAIANVDWQQVGENIGNFLAGIKWKEILESFGKLFWEAINAVIDTWKGMFKTAPIETTIATAVFGIPIIIRGLTKLISLITSIAAVVTKVVTFARNLVGVFQLMANAGMTLHAAMTTIFGTIATVITGIIGTVSGLVISFVNFVKMLQEGFSWVNEAFMLLGIAIAGVGAVILGVPATIAATVAGIVAAVSTIVILVKDNWEIIKGFFSSIGTWLNENVITPVVSGFENLKKKVLNAFSTLWNNIKNVWNKVTGWFTNNIATPIITLFNGVKTRVSAYFEGLWIIVKAIWIIVSDWFNKNVVTPITSLFSKLKENVSNFFKNLWNDIKSVWNIVSTWFKTNVTEPVKVFFHGVWTDVKKYFKELWSDIKEVWKGVSSWFDEKVIEPLKSSWETATSAIAGFFDGLWNGIKAGVVSAMNAVIGGIESGINFIINGINNIIGGFNKVVSWAAKVADEDWGGVEIIPTVTIPKISGYELGGFPNKADLFFANENGVPELVGTMGGKTAVASGTEITGISDAIYSTSSQEVQLMREQNMLLRGILQKEFGISSNDLFDSVRSSAEEYTNRTGTPAFVY